MAEPRRSVQYCDSGGVKLYRRQRLDDLLENTRCYTRRSSPSGAHRDRLRREVAVRPDPV